MTSPTFTDAGSGHPLLLLHGGGGPQTVAGFAGSLAGHGFRVVTPTHPGFGGTERPANLETIHGLASIYRRLLDDMDLGDVTIVGNSIGGWIAAELALLHPNWLTRLVLVDAVGIEVPGHPVADFFSLTFPEIAQLSYHDPERFRIDPAALPEEQRAVLAGNRAALATYTAAGMIDPELRGRLAGIDVPALVVWGAADRIADPVYGRAFAAAIPGAEFALLPETGHLPQLESPDRLLETISEFVNRA